MCDQCGNHHSPRPWVSLMEARQGMSKRLLVCNIPPAMTDEQVLDLALPAARESRESLFGWSVTRLPDNPTAARVVLNIN